MQEVNQISTPVVTSQVVAEQPKTSNFLVVLLSVLLVLSVSIAGFFAYQTQKLSKELNTLKLEPESTFPMYTEPTETGSAILDDSTVNLKTYTNTDYLISYPSTYVISNVADGATGEIPTDATNVFISESINSKYEDRLIDIKDVGMMVEISPVEQWQKTTVLVSAIESLKFTKIDKTSSFDIYQIPTHGASGLEVYVNNKNTKALDLLNNLKVSIFTN